MNFTRTLREKRLVRAYTQDQKQAKEIFLEQIKKFEHLRGSPALEAIKEFWEIEIDRSYMLLRDLGETQTEERIRAQESLKIGEKFLSYIDSRVK